MTKWIKPGDCESAHCLEIQEAGSHILPRSSLAPEYVAEATREEFRAFVQAAKAGQYDQL